MGCGFALLLRELLVAAILGHAAENAWSTSRVLLIPRAARGRLAAMCRAEGRGGDEFVAGWVRSINAFANTPPEHALEPSHRDRAPLHSDGEGLGVTKTASKKELGEEATSISEAGGAATTSLRAAALRRPSAFDPGLDEEPTRRYTLKLDEAALLRFAGAGKRLIASWTTGGPKRYSIARNLAFSIRKNCGPELERMFVFVALDQDAYDRALEDGFQVVLNEGSVDLKDDIWKMRWLIQVTFLSLGLEVLVVDSDIVFFRDPFEHVHFDSDQEVSTDHFFPRDMLWATWLRPAEHINTGFIFSRPSEALVAFLVEFLDRHYHEYFDRHLERDGMDQRVYNRFVVEKFDAEPQGVYAVYEDRVFDRLDWQQNPSRTTRFLPREGWMPRGNGWGATASGGKRIKIRLLDPAEIAHGMNFFWRKAHRLRKSGPDLPGGQYRPPAVAHVNGVDPKLYFLRDRNAWYVDEWHERFGDRPSFMMYRHPVGLSLKDDFEYMVAAIEVAAYLRRRVVLPDTMNCANSPAYQVWRMNETLLGEPGCTYDYFAHANGLYEVYSRVKPYCVEAGLKRTAPFQALLGNSSWHLPSLDELRHTEALRTEVLGMQNAKGAVAFDSVRVLLLDSPGVDVRELRDGLRRGDFGFRMNHERIFSCAHQQVLTSAMACLDQPYIEEFGIEALRQCEAVPQGCGPVGICCCWPFWGYGEKLQYFTGVSWQLPCNCGLDICEGYDRPSTSGEERCCRHRGNDQMYPEIEPGVFPCREPGQWQGLTASEDAHTYSTSSLSDFLRNRRTAEQTFETCRLDRVMRRNEPFREVSLRWCNLQVSAFLLREDAHQRAKVWWEWLLPERRGIGNASLLVVAMAGNGSETDNTALQAPKLRHDLEQLRHLARRGLGAAAATAASWRIGLDVTLIEETLIPGYIELEASLDDFMLGRRTREEVLGTFAAVRPYYNRALYVPNVGLSAGSWAIRGAGRASDFNAVERSLREEGVAVIDDFLTSDALRLAQELLVDSTIWFESKAGGSLLKAQLKDGLHADLGLQIARELRESYAQPWLGVQPLLDIIAYKFEASSGNPGLAPHCEDGVVAMSLWVVPDSANLDPARNGLRIHEVKVPPEYSHAEAHSVEGSAAIRELLRRNASASTRVRYRANRAVFWKARSIYETDWTPSKWARGYESRRVEWLFLFGRSQVRGDHRKTKGSFVPTFEGSEDRRTDHYYANDHDHR